MALTNAEKQKRYREKQKLLKAGMIEIEKSPLDTSFLAHGFFDWLEEGEDRKEAFEYAVELISSLPQLTLKPGKSGQEMIAIATAITNCLEASRVLAQLVAAFKQSKVMARIESLTPAEQTDTKRMAELAQLMSLYQGYGKKSRHEFQTFLLQQEASAMMALAESLDNDEQS